jgi:hypothetical protein
MTLSISIIPFRLSGLVVALIKTFQSEHLKAEQPAAFPRESYQKLSPSELRDFTEYRHPMPEKATLMLKTWIASVLLELFRNGTNLNLITSIKYIINIRNPYNR